MSLVLGALGGLGEAAQRMGETNQKAWLDQDLQREQSDLAQQRAIALEKFKNDMTIKTADDMRNAQVGRIDSAVNGLVPQARLDKLNAAYGDGSALTQDDVLPEELDKYGKLSDSEMAGIRTKAAIKTGDIDPKTAATMGQSAELAQMKIDSAIARAEDKNATMKEINEARIMAMDRSAEMRLQAAREKAASGAAEKSTLNQQLNSETQNIRATTALISTLTRQLDQVTSKEQKKDIQEQIDGYRLDIEQSKGVKNLILKQLNLPTVDDLPKPKDAPAPKPAAASGKADAMPAKVLTWNHKTGKFD